MADSTRKHSLELKIPPPVIALVTAGLMWLVARSTPGFEFKFFARDVVATALAVAGILTSGSGFFSFKRAGTTVNPTKPESSTVLVNTGIYKRTRNPMYLGLLFVLLAWGIFLANGLSFLLLPLFILYMNRFQIEPEERALASRFGPQFAAYKAKVRRWL